MQPTQLIARKRDGHVLTDQEIRFFIRGICDGRWADYQTSAMLMAMYIRGLNTEETASLTLAMADSGERLDLSALPGIKVDKHSTGGVADTTTLILVPLLAACDVPVVKMSGRGLGFTGGTIDKLASIPGFRTDLSINDAIHQARRIGMVILAQTARLTPADRILYGLRDVTATVDSIPLIAASIMSKKIAAGSDAIVLDVKCGSGAFMRTEADARLLAETMVSIGHQVGRQVRAVISRMDQPLGDYIGNQLEVLEAIDVLSGRRGGDLLEVTRILGTQLLELAGRTENEMDARQLLGQQIQSGRALDCFRTLIKAQGGDSRIVDQPDRLPHAESRIAGYASSSGYVRTMDAAALGESLVDLGGGRRRHEDTIDLSAGIIMHKRLGDPVEKGEVVLEVLGQSAKVQTVRDQALAAIHLDRHPPCRRPVIMDVIV